MRARLSRPDDRSSSRVFGETALSTSPGQHLLEQVEWTTPGGPPSAAYQNQKRTNRGGSGGGEGV